MVAVKEWVMDIPSGWREWLDYPSGKRFTSAASRKNGSKTLPLVQQLQKKYIWGAQKDLALGSDPYLPFLA